MKKPKPTIIPLEYMPRPDPGFSDLCRKINSLVCTLSCAAATLDASSDSVQDENTARAAHVVSLVAEQLVTFRSEINNWHMDLVRSEALRRMEAAEPVAA